MKLSRHIRLIFSNKSRCDGWKNHYLKVGQSDNHHFGQTLSLQHQIFLEISGFLSNLFPGCTIELSLVECRLSANQIFLDFLFRFLMHLYCWKSGMILQQKTMRMWSELTIFFF